MDDDKLLRFVSERQAMREEGFVTLHVTFDEAGTMIAGETCWAKIERSDWTSAILRVDNLPFFHDKFTFGDLVRAHLVPGSNWYEYDELVESGGWQQQTLVFKSSEAAKAGIGRLRGSIAEERLKIENGGHGLVTLVTRDPETTVAIEDVIDALDAEDQLDQSVMSILEP